MKDSAAGLARLPSRTGGRLPPAGSREGLQSASASFPSFIPHETVPPGEGAERISVAFDVTAA
jgi:hypothetical protein